MKNLGNKKKKILTLLVGIFFKGTKHDQMDLRFVVV